MLIFETVRVLAIPTSILVVFQISICSRMILRLSRTYRANCCWLIYSSSSCNFGSVPLTECSGFPRRVVTTRTPSSGTGNEPDASQWNTKRPVSYWDHFALRFLCHVIPTSSRHLSTSVCRTSVISWVPDFARRVAPLVVS